MNDPNLTGQQEKIQDTPEMESTPEIPGEKKPGDNYAKGRGKDTLFRITVRNQINMVGIADNKANMIITINTIIITLVVTALGSNITLNDIPLIDQKLTVPFSVLLIFSLSSAVFAVLAARPKIIKKEKRRDKMSMLFFGNFYQQPLEDYLEDVDNLLGSNQDIYKHLTIDMYNNGQVLNKKYYQLAVSYTILLIGLISTVLAYFIVLGIETLQASVLEASLY